MRWVALLCLAACASSPTRNGEGLSPDRSDGLVIESPVRTGPPWCAPDSAAATRFLLWKAQRMGNAAERQAAAGGWDAARPPSVVAGGMRIVTDEVLCERASRILDTLVLPASPRAERITLLEAPNYYWVISRVTSGEFTVAVRMSRQFEPEPGVSLW